MTKTAIEHYAANIEATHALSSMHIFKQGDMWRVFGSRKLPTGVQASVEEGRGADIYACLENLDARLSGDQIHKVPFPVEFA